jgi:hypothetical protein
LRYPTTITVLQSVRFRIVAGVLGAILSVGEASAYDFSPPTPGFAPSAVNTFQFYVGDEETYDDNLFRIPPGTVGVPGAVFPNASQSDAVNTTTLGAQGKYDIARQEVEFNLRANDNQFIRNTVLNNISSSGVGTWNWTAGPYLTGQVSTIYDHSLASFSETRYSGKDLVTSLEELGSARYQLGPHWAVYGQVRGSTIDHSAEPEKYNNFHNKAGNAGVQFVNNGMDTYGFEYQFVDLTFNQTLGGAQAYNYKEDSGRFLVHYGLSDKTIIDGYAGYLRRQYPGLVIGSYSGEIGRVALTYNLTEKTQFLVSGWHELHAYIDAESNYFVAQGVSIAPVWNASEKLSFTLLASYENQDYIASNSVIVATPRHDKVNGEQATIRYSPRDAWIFNMFIRHEKRESNQNAFSYTDNVISGNVTFRFW